MTVLYGWGPMFGAPSPSPYVIKCDMQLQMLGVNFKRAIADLENVSKHKAPYVQDEGRIIEDSTFIRLYFEEKLGDDLDEAAFQCAGFGGGNQLSPFPLSPIDLIEHDVDDETFDVHKGAPGAASDVRELLAFDLLGRPI